MKSVDSLSPLANELLRRIDFFERVVGAFEVQRVVETHISLLLIGSSLTLKFKKPVDLGFVCYRTLEDRWRCAVNEVLLNRRLSTHVYRGVLPIRSEGRIDPLTDLLPTPILQAQPQMSEVAVVMNTYDEEQLLSSKLHTDSSDIEQCIVAVANRLATFHQSPGVKAIPSLVPSIAELASTVQDNILELQKAHRPVLSDAESAALAIVSSYTNSFFEHRRVMLEERIRNEHIVDGHGDLRAEHVCFFESDVDCLDCVEFNQSIRTIDVLNDIAFLKMDLDFLGRPDVARAFIEAYAKASMELVPRELLNFYACYRSMVRAKVDALTADSVRNEAPASRSEEAGGLSRRARHLGLAARYALAIDFSWVVAVTGLMGSGKSTFARYLQGITDAQLLQSDHLRGALFPVSGRNEAFGHGKYSDQ
ncbi:MAG: hypothetical protein KDD44_07645, partial [Bdellovibrionales bacterium]|nr:hypothetical protein [Bdellovibrionales bacterium]